MSTAQRIIKNSGYLYLRIFIVTGISLWTTRLVLNALGATDYGIFNIVGGVISMLAFLNTAMASATQRFMSYSEGENNKEKQKAVFNISMIFHLIVAIVVTLLLVALGIYFFNNVLNIPSERLFAAKTIFLCLIISTVLGIMSVPYEAVLNAHENMLYYSIIGVLDSLLRLGVALFLYYTLYDRLIVYGSLMALIPIITLTIMRVYCHKKYNECVIAPRKYYDKSLMTEMFRFASWNFLPNIANVFVVQGSSIVLNAFWGVLINAAHGVANQLAGYLLIFSNSMQKALNPVIVKTEGEHDRNKMVLYSLTGNKFSYLLFAFFAIPACVEMPYILKLWLKSPPDYAILFCRLIILRRMIGQLTVTFSTSIGATGQIKQRSLTNFIIMVLALPVSWFAFKEGAPVHSLYIILLFMVLLTSLSDVFYMKRQCNLKIPIFLKRVIAPCIIITIIVLLGDVMFCWWMDSSFLRLLCVFIIGSGIFCIATYIIGLEKNEKVLFKSLFYKLLKKND